MHNPAPVLENNTHKLQWDLIINNKKRELAKLSTLLSRLTTIKLKEFEKNDKYLDLAKELKKLWNMQVTIIPIVIGAFGTVTK